VTLHRCYSCKSEDPSSGFCRWHPSRCRDCCRAYDRTRNAYKQQYQQGDKFQAYVKGWRQQQQESDPDRWARLHSSKTPEIGARSQARRRAMLAGVESERYSRHEIIVRDNQTCHVCKEFVPLEELQIDHVVPISRGGADVKSNVAVAHKLCNLKKWANVS
jgi:5-methylcytosine-specific restriction endonuclease McrA